MIIKNKVIYSTGEVLTSKAAPLQIENDCLYIVNCTDITTENNSFTVLDYGNGTCDNIATLTDNKGNETTIELDI